MTEGLTFRGKLTLEDVLDMQHYRALAALRRPVRLLIGRSRSSLRTISTATD